MGLGSPDVCSMAIHKCVVVIVICARVVVCVCCTRYECSVFGTHSFRLFAFSNERSRPRAHRSTRTLGLCLWPV